MSKEWQKNLTQQTGGVVTMCVCVCAMCVFGKSFQFFGLIGSWCVLLNFIYWNKKKVKNVWEGVF